MMIIITKVLLIICIVLLIICIVLGGKCGKCRKLQKARLKAQSSMPRRIGIWYQDITWSTNLFRFIIEQDLSHKIIQDFYYSNEEFIIRMTNNRSVHFVSTISAPHSFTHSFVESGDWMSQEIYNSWIAPSTMMSVEKIDGEQDYQKILGVLELDRTKIERDGFW